MTISVSYARTMAGARRIAAQRAEAIEQPPVMADPEPIEDTVIAFVPPVRALISNVAAKYGLTYQDIIGPSRENKIVVARHEAICTVRRARPEMTLPHLGKEFRRDHTTVLHALRKRGLK